jgi:hypothetical protein
MAARASARRGRGDTPEHVVLTQQLIQGWQLVHCGRRQRLARMPLDEPAEHEAPADDFLGGISIDRWDCTVLSQATATVFLQSYPLRVQQNQPFRSDRSHFESSPIRRFAQPLRSGMVVVIDLLLQSGILAENCGCSPPYRALAGQSAKMMPGPDPRQAPLETSGGVAHRAGEFVCR